MNKTFFPERKRFTALHELGYLVLNFIPELTGKEQENFCSLFASELLIPSDVFISLIGKSRHDISYQELKAIQSQYGISADAFMHKAYDLKIMSKQRYTYYCIKKNSDGSFKSMIETSVFAEEKSNRFIRLVYRALSDELITISKAASLLEQSILDVRKDLALV